LNGGAPVTAAPGAGCGAPQGQQGEEGIGDSRQQAQDAFRRALGLLNEAAANQQRTTSAVGG
jgi:hypothetical protein